MNYFVGIGRLTAGCELKYTKDGVAFAKFSICINKVWKDKNGERQEKPNFFNCVLWGKYGEAMAKHLTKGKQIGIAAELEQSSWTDNNGNNHSAVQLNVNEVSLLASPKGDKESGPHNSPPGNKNAPDNSDIPF